MKQVPGWRMQVGQGKELPEPVAPYWKGAIQPDSYYVVSVANGKTSVVGGPFPTEMRAFGDIDAITDTSGT